MTKEQSIPGVFQAQAAATPEAIAVRYEARQLTYRQLNERANRLAHRLRDLGVTANAPVALILERSPEMIAAILGVLKAGGSYVPIDPAAPKERMAFMLSDCRAPVVVTQQSLAASLPAHEGTAVCVEDDFSNYSPENPAPACGPGDVAYIIYTSGSTGRPKGVLITHENVLRLFTQTDPWYHFDQSDTWTMFHSYAFDFSVWEIWGALLYGGKLIVVPYLISRSPEAFYELLEREKVTVLNQTPSAFRQLIWAENSAPTPRKLALKWVIFGGEALALPSLKPWFARHGDQQPRLVNMYGITETTVHVTYRPITQADVDANLGSVIGEPIPDLELLLLDENLRPVTVGCPGEICVGGAGLALGYLNRPDLTAEKFVPHPSGQGRLYRSGDLARRLPNGELEYIGRKDFQVKIRGHRIELGEIEDALLKHPAVRECVALARGEGEEKQLAAYIVTKSPVSVTALREWLTPKLPTPMIPAFFVFLDTLPLTINGKVDRKALPDPEHNRPQLAQEFAAPANDREKALAEIWQDVLAIDRVGRHDSFFELGGDSIRSIQALARAGERGLHISLQQLFEHPTVAELAELASGSSQGESIPLLPPLAQPPEGVEDAYPMTKLQLGMVFHSDYDPLSAVFHDVFSFCLRAPFDEAKLRAAIDRLTQRHPIFRTSFELSKYGEPLQLVHHKVNTPLTVEDVRGWPEKAQRQALVEWVELEKRRRFDWTVAPMMRLHAQRQSDQVFQFIVSFHHIIMDGWSLAAMLTELFQDYTSAEEPAAPQVKYRDFVALEQAAIASQETSEFWRKKLGGATMAALPRWPKNLCKGGREQVRGPEIIYPRETLEALQKLSRSTRVPLRTTLLAAHLRVMQFLTGQSDIVAGLVTNGRPQTVDGEKLIGLFLNTLPLRMTVGDASWRDLVEKTFAAEKEIIPHRRCPMSRVLQLAGGHALYETAFDFVQFHVYNDLPGYGERTFVEDHYFEANNFNFYVTFMLSAEASELQMHFDYNPNEFCPEQIKQICGYYERALQALAADPDSSCQVAPLLAPEEQKQITEDWNRTAAPYPQVCVHELIQAQVEKTPDNIAATFGERSLTYTELNVAANTLAVKLQKQGLRRGDLVGIRCERSLEMLVCVLGVLKTGAAYVPLDPNYPQERLDFMARDAGLKIILTNQDVDLSSSDEDAAPAPTGVTPDDVAYMIYTSGSTGQPKGVQVLHRGVVNFLASMQREPGFTSEDVLLAVTTLSFDIAGLELLLPLTVGGEVEIASAEEAVDFTKVARALERSGATVMQATPTTWRGLIETGWEGSAKLKALCGGEALTRELANQLVDRCREVWNMYGPTETTIWSSVCRVEKGEGPISIGHPIANTQIHILDCKMRPVPTGADGEIYIGGDGLARGYFKREQLTAERFPQNPFDAQGKLYRTGDIGRWLPDGRLLCAGRVDQQVKIRGHRIELGEIESALGRHPKVAAAAVTAREDGPRGTQLVAYWVSRNGPLGGDELRNFLAQHLPAPMLPARFMLLKELPLTPNGKIDRKRLPAPEGDRPDMSQEFVAPRTPIEKVVGAAWSEALQIDRLGIHDNFFALGGHSLTAMQVVARLRDQLDADLTVASLFEHPTIEQHALFLLTELMEAEA